MRHLLTYLLLISLTLVSPKNSVAQTVELEKGQTAPFSGSLVPPFQMDAIKKDLEERDRYKLLNESLDKSLNLAYKQIDLHQQKSNILLEENIKLSKPKGEWDFILGFGIGTIVTILILNAVKASQ